MARKVQTTGKLTLTFAVNGHMDLPDEREAIMRAQRKNAEIWETSVKALAEREVGKAGHPPSPSGPRNRGSYPGSMQQYYSAEVTEDGDIVGSNPTLRALLFEEGSPDHPIEASGQHLGGAQRPPRTRGGRFARQRQGGLGRRNLRFHSVKLGGIVYAPEVWHPGQEPNPIMEQAMEENLDLFAENIADALAEEVAGG